MKFELPKGFEVPVIQSAMRHMVEMTKTGGGFSTSDGLITFSYDVEDKQWYQARRGEDPHRVSVPIVYGCCVLKTAVEIGTNVMRSGIGEDLDNIMDIVQTLQAGKPPTNEEINKAIQAVMSSNMKHKKYQKQKLSEELKDLGTPIIHSKIKSDVNFNYAVGADHPEKLPIDPENPPAVVLERIIEGVAARIDGAPFPEYCFERGEVPPRKVLERILADLKLKLAEAKRREDGDGPEIKWQAPSGFDPSHN